LLGFSVRHSGRRFLAFVVAALLPIVLVTGLAAQTKKKKSTKPKPTPCRAGCKPDTTSPDVATATPEDAATHKELSELARNLHNAAPGAYEKLSAFSTKHSGDIWGARAALALGYDDYQKDKAPQALAWFTKAKADTLLREYVLFWTAQTKRVLKRNPEALADLNTIQREYPNTAIKEQVLDALAVTAVETGHAQDAIDALTAYSGTATKPALLLDRAHAYQIAGQTVRAAKDYQVVYYKYPLSDEAKAAGIALTPLQKILRSEFPYATAEMQEQRAQALFDAHKWRDARPEFEKLVAMLHDNENPTRQRAQLRVVQCKIQSKASMTLISSLVTPDPEVDAERLFALSQFQRSAKKESAMLASIDDLNKQYPDRKC
jgi:tetratricopeptide (TPR) repeat protein